MHHRQNTREIPVVFDCRGQQLLGIIHQSDFPATVGVLVVVGGPQYRVGSHRQFILLARHLAEQGIPVMRFDVRGMGDGEGDQRNFEALDDDICSAIDRFVASCTGLTNVIIWGLCDAASAALFYAYQDHRVTGLVLLNPWVFTEQGAAKTYLKHYYVQRVLSADFWRKVFSMKFDVLGSLTSLVGFVNTIRRRRCTTPSDGENTIATGDLTLPTRMRECWKRFTKPVLLILSGRDMTADEFRMVVAGDPGWQVLLNDSLVTRRELPEADHTFSSAAWRNQVAAWTLNWIEQL